MEVAVKVAEVHQRLALEVALAARQELERSIWLNKSYLAYQVHNNRRIFASVHMSLQGLAYDSGERGFIALEFWYREAF